MAMSWSTPPCLAAAASMGASTVATGTAAPCYPTVAITSTTSSPTAPAARSHPATHTATMAPSPTAPATASTRTPTIMWVLHHKPGDWMPYSYPWYSSFKWPGILLQQLHIQFDLADCGVCALLSGWRHVHHSPPDGVVWLYELSEPLQQQ